MKSIIVIGGGASGLVSAIYASLSGYKVTILEKNNNPGKKILITGANGMLAKSVIKRLKGNELICTDVSNLDITDEKA